MNSNKIYAITTVLMGILFLLTGISKILEFNIFINSMFQVLPLSYNFVISLGSIIILVELFSAILCFIKRYQLAGLIIIRNLTVLFILFLSTVYFYIPNYECNCFGILGVKLPLLWQICFDIVILIITIVLSTSLRQKKENPINFKVTYLILIAIFSLQSIGFYIYEKNPNKSLLYEKLIKISPQLAEKKSSQIITLDPILLNCSLCLNSLIQQAEEFVTQPENNDSLTIIILNNENPSINSSPRRINQLFTKLNIKAKAIVDRNGILNKLRLRESKIIEIRNNQIHKIDFFK